MVINFPNPLTNFTTELASPNNIVPPKAPVPQSVQVFQSVKVSHKPFYSILFQVLAPEADKAIAVPEKTSGFTNAPKSANVAYISLLSAAVSSTPLPLGIFCNSS